MAVCMNCWCLVEVVEVELVGFYACGASHLEVVFDGLEFFGVAADEVEVGVVFGEVFCCFVCDGGGGAYDEYFLGFHGCVFRTTARVVPTLFFCVLSIVFF